MATTLVNKATTHGVTASSTTVSPGWTLAAGNVASVMLAVSQGTSTVLNPTVTDSLGNVYTLDSWYSNQITTGNLQVFLFSAPILHAGGGDVITITFTASCQFWSTHVAEYNIGGPGFALAVDKVSQFHAGGTTGAISSGSLATTAAGELAICAVVTGASATLGYAASAGFTIENSYLPTSGGANFAYEDWLAASGTFNPGFTLSGTAVSYSIAAVSYKVASSYLAGSLHPTGQVVLATSAAVLSGLATCSLAFWWQVNSNADLNLSTGTIVYNFASGSGQLKYFPATQLATLTVNGSSNSVVGTWKVQLGVGYHVCWSWANGAQAIYVNGQAIATGTLAVATATTGALQFGADAGAGIPINQQIGQLATWTTYALTAADAVALAARSILPTGTATPATSWFPLAGGTPGNTPLIGDPAFTDGGAAGLTLSVATGTLANAPYATSIAGGSSIAVIPEVTKSGTVLLVRARLLQPAANGYAPDACVTNLVGTLSANWGRNAGAAIQLGAPIFFDVQNDTSFAAYGLQCGTVGAIATVTCGSGYTSAPTVTINNAGTGGTGLAVGTPVLATGVIAYTITAAGSGYNKPPTISFGGPGTGAAARAVIYQGQLCGVVVTAGGTGYTVAPTITLGADGAPSRAAVLSANVSGGAVTSVDVIDGGAGYDNPPAVTIGAPPGNTGPNSNTTAQAVAVVGDANSVSPGGIVAILPLAGGLWGAGTGYVSAPAVTITGSATATATVGQYVLSIPVTNAGSNYNLPPTITLSGGGATTQGTVVAKMTGVLASDALTVAYPANYLATNIFENNAVGSPLGGHPAATAQAVANWVGQLEGSTPFVGPFTARAGGNMGSQPCFRGGAAYVFKNQYFRHGGWIVNTGSGILTLDPADRSSPKSWTQPASTTIRVTVYGPQPVTVGNFIDGMGMPAYAGTFLAAYDDAQVNTAHASSFTLYSSNDAANQVVAPVALAGNPAPVTIPNGNVTIAGGLITAISLTTPTPVSFTGTWTGAGVTVTGGGGTGFAGIVTCTGGVPTSITCIVPGAPSTTYTTSGLVVQVYSTSRSGTTVQSAWSFTPIASPTEWSPTVSIMLAQDQGLWNLSGVGVYPPNRDGSINTAIDRNNPYDGDDAALSTFTASNGHTLGISRWMDSEMGNGGVSNLQLPTDLPATPPGANWHNSARFLLGCYFTAARFFNTDPARGPGGDSTYTSVSTKIYSPQNWATSGPDAPYATTGNLVLGDPVIYAVAAMGDGTNGVMRAATIAGTGVPAGAYVAFLGKRIVGWAASGSAIVTGIDPADLTGLTTTMPVFGVSAGQIQIGRNLTISAVGSNQITLSATLTVTGVITLVCGMDRLITMGLADGTLANALSNQAAASLSFTNPKYVALPPSDNGFAIGASSSPSKSVVMELVSPIPHGISSGDGGVVFGDRGVPYTGPVATAPGFNAAKTATGTFATGSAIVTAISVDATLSTPGSALSGTGIPAGAKILSVQSSTQFTMTANFTGSNGSAAFVISAFAPASLTSAEGGYFATSPYTLAVAFFVSNASVAPPVAGGPQQVASALSIGLTSAACPGGWTLVRYMPDDSGANSLPYGAGAGFMAQLANSARQVNIPVSATDSLVSLIAQRDLAVLGPDTLVYLEDGNENWNGLYMSSVYRYAVSVLISYATSGSPLGVPVPVEPLAGYGPASVAAAGHNFATYKAAWLAAGRPASLLKLIIGAQWGGPLNAQGPLGAATQLGYCQEFGIQPDRVALGAYLEVTPDWPVVRAFAPDGSPIAGAQGLPVAAICDVLRYHNQYCQGNVYTFYAHGLAILNFGQPLRVPVLGSSSAANSFVAGSYYLYYTFTDAGGGETTVGISQAGPLTVPGGSCLTFTMPNWPSWATGLNVYLTPPSGVPGTQRYYASFARSQYGQGNTYPVGTAVPLTMAAPGTRPPPPAVNTAIHSYTPSLMAYEGSTEIAIPVQVPLSVPLQQDMMTHPAGSDFIYGWYATMAAGCPYLTGSGMTDMNYFSIYDGPQYPHQWVLGYGPCVAPGIGATRYCTQQGTIGVAGASFQANDPTQANGQQSYLDGLQRFIRDSAVALLTLPVAQGTYVLAGGVDTFATRTSAVQGHYALAGGSATLTTLAGVVMAAGNGAYALAGGDATFVAATAPAAGGTAWAPPQAYWAPPGVYANPPQVSWKPPQKISGH